MKHFAPTALQGAPLRTTSADRIGIGQSKWSLLKLIEEGREVLGLKGTSVTVLRAILSFIKSDQISEARDADHICFASNASLAQRACVSVATVERHISKLVSAGLVARRRSGNGKRWARRDRSGQVVLATGLSVHPLMARVDELQDMVTEQQTRRENARLLRDRCALALVQVLEQSSEVSDAFIAHARRQLRCKLDPDQLTHLLHDIQNQIPDDRKNHPQMCEEKSGETDKLRGSDAENAGHKETQLTHKVEEQEIAKIDVSPAEMERAFPKLCSELRFSKSEDAAQRHMDDLASYLNFGSFWHRLRQQGPALSFMVLGYLFERLDQIRNPRAYASKLLMRLTEGQLDHRSLLRPPRVQPCLAL